MKSLLLRYVSDIIGEEYRSWQAGNTVHIVSPCSTGKNYFIINKLIPYAKSQGKRVLYICNRSALKMEMKMDVWDSHGQLGNITITSYQQLSMPSCTIDINHYDYVFCDEIHYILVDSFTGRTDIALHELCKPIRGVLILATATPTEFDRLILNGRDVRDVGEHYEYYQKADLRYITPICFRTTEEICNAVKLSGAREKWVIFIRSKKMREPIENEIGAHNVTYVESGSPNIQEIIKTKTFPTKVLVTTSALDNGINLKDPDICHIVIYDIDKIRFLQMLGRIRLSDTVTGTRQLMAHDVRLYIPMHKESVFTGMLGNLKSKWSFIARYEEDKDKFTETYRNNFQAIPKDCFNLTKENTIEINKVGKYATSYHIRNMEHFISKIHSTDREATKEYLINPAPLGIIMEWLNQPSIYPPIIYAEIQKEDKTDVFKFFNSMVGIRLVGKEQKDLIINRVESVLFGKPVKRPSSINKMLRAEELPFIVISKKFNGINYWIVQRVLMWGDEDNKDVYEWEERGYYDGEV